MAVYRYAGVLGRMSTTILPLFVFCVTDMEILVLSFVCGAVRTHKHNICDPFSCHSDWIDERNEWLLRNAPLRSTVIGDGCMQITK